MAKFSDLVIHNLPHERVRTTGFSVAQKNSILLTKQADMRVQVAFWDRSLPSHDLRFLSSKIGTFWVLTRSHILCRHRIDADFQ